MEQEKKDSLEKTLNIVVDEIRDSYSVEIIKSREIIPMLNMKNMQECGFWVKLQLNSRFGYDDDQLEDWKDMLGATQYRISIMNYTLYATFKVYFKE